ncbi:DUF305 domain-containing protein [Streptosporangium sp. CA-135522]|uniref:DUF305 domain-containing protein n=1 Tax=Streptosporangium sp. CA-135522 TaxID=3240072 RepID=UPI003D8A33EB
MFIGRSVSRRLALTVTAGIGTLALLTACGGDKGAMAGLVDTPSAATTSPGQQPNAPVNDADRMFAQMMIEHHKQAVEMAELAETRAKSPQVKSLAAKIKAAQEPEIATMTGWLSEWGRPAMPSGGEEHDMSPMPSPGMEGHMPGMMTDEDMKKLEAAKGTEFDRMFLQMMTDHHKGAVEMAQMEQKQGVNPAARKLAETIEITQQMEIEQMRKLLDRL